jgi:F-type H+-transporting ATPase subunit delta
VAAAAAIARRYARALFGLGTDTAAAERLLDELDELTAAATSSPELLRVLFTPIHPRQDRRAVVGELAERLGLSAELRMFALLLVEENRSAILPEIRAALRELVDEARGRVVARVRSARPLDAGELDALRRSLARRTGAEVQIEAEVDARLLGGLVVRVGDLLLDGSVRSQLEDLGASLREGPA